MITKYPNSVKTTFIVAKYQSFLKLFTSINFIIVLYNLKKTNEEDRVSDSVYEGCDSLYALMWLLETKKYGNEDQQSKVNCSCVSVGSWKDLIWLWRENIYTNK
jgi:hypothetical protein